MHHSSGFYHWIHHILCFLCPHQPLSHPADSFIECTSTYWLALNGCGINGVNCEPFTDFSIRVPLSRTVQWLTLANIRTVGVEEPVHVPLVVGRGDKQKTYRSEAFICVCPFFRLTVILGYLRVQAEVSSLTHGKDVQPSVWSEALRTTCPPPRTG